MYTTHCWQIWISLDDDIFLSQGTKVGARLPALFKRGHRDVVYHHKISITVTPTGQGSINKQYQWSKRIRPVTSQSASCNINNTIPEALRQIVEAYHAYHRDEQGQDWMSESNWISQLGLKPILPGSILDCTLISLKIGGQDWIGIGRFLLLKSVYFNHIKIFR